MLVVEKTPQSVVPRWWLNGCFSVAARCEASKRPGRQRRRRQYYTGRLYAAEQTPNLGLAVAGRPFLTPGWRMRVVRPSTGQPLSTYAAARAMKIGVSLLRRPRSCPAFRMQHRCGRKDGETRSAAGGGKEGTSVSAAAPSARFMRLTARSTPCRCCDRKSGRCVGAYLGLWDVLYRGCVPPVGRLPAGAYALYDHKKRCGIGSGLLARRSRTELAQREG